MNAPFYGYLTSEEDRFACRPRRYHLLLPLPHPHPGASNPKVRYDKVIGFADSVNGVYVVFWIIKPLHLTKVCRLQSIAAIILKEFEYASDEGKA
ncbi:unnamed protein product, partial [Iphiclides podalirius]